MHTPSSRRRSGFRPVAATALAIATVIGLASCSDADPANTPAPGGTQTPTNASDVRAPNGTNMGATPINAGTLAP